MGFQGATIVFLLRGLTSIGSGRHPHNSITRRYFSWNKWSGRRRVKDSSGCLLTFTAIPEKRMSFSTDALLLILLMIREWKQRLFPFWWERFIMHIIMKIVPLASKKIKKELREWLSSNNLKSLRFLHWRLLFVGLKEGPTSQRSNTRN